jgi:hypothetical protein
MKYEKLKELNKEVYHQLIAVGAGETLYFEYVRESYEPLYPLHRATFRLEGYFIDGKSVGYTVGRGYVLDKKMSVSRITPTEIEMYMYDIMDNKIQARIELSRIHIFEDQTLPLRYQ